jgi:hypothetical protein
VPVLRLDSAALLGYIFFAVTRSIIQGSAAFPDIPGELPGILLFSAGTSVMATGIVTAKGSKGAGEIGPTLADFITTGGVVAPERLQFVVWTVAGICTFLTIVFKSDPLRLSDLPRIPDGFLQLMGISSTAYLAGKLARKPGPVITGLSIDPPTTEGGRTTLVLHLTGVNLDPRGKIKADGQPLGDYLAKIDDPKPDPPTGFFSEMRVTLAEADNYFVGSHILTLVNSDAQAADVSFPVDPMVVAPVASVPHGKNLSEVRSQAATSWPGRPPDGRMLRAWRWTFRNRQEVGPPSRLQPPWSSETPRTCRYG